MRRHPALAALPAAMLAAWLGALACATGVRAGARETAPAGVVACALDDGAGDADGDTLGDGCELALAQAFAPALVVDGHDCLWTRDSLGARLAGGYLFAAQPVAGGVVRLAFMPAWHRDCGWSGAPCVLRGPRCGAHAGDSEIMLVDVARSDGGRWTTTGIFLSAHCFGRSDGRCRWYRGRALEAFAWVNGVRGGAPVVWVAKGKHGGYPTRDDCDAGHWGFDSCDANAETYRFPVRALAQNVGSRARPLPGGDGCLTSARLVFGASGTDRGARECPWDEGQPFRGWQAGRDGAAPSSYARYLSRFAGF